MALTMRRLLLAGRALRPRSGGRSGAIVDHCSSVSSNRLSIYRMEHTARRMESGIDDFEDTT